MMHLRYLIDSDMGSLATVMTASYTKAVYEEAACRSWFGTTPQKVAGIFNEEDELIAFLIFNINPDGLCYIRDFSTPDRYRTLETTREMTEVGVKWLKEQGGRDIRMESCAEDYRLLHLYSKLGFKILKHLSDRGNAEPGIVLEVTLGR